MAEDFSSDSFESSTSTSSSNSSSAISWVNWFCSLPGHEYFLEVPEEFIEDDFNLCGLNAMVPHYNECLDMILDIEDDTHSRSDSERSGDSRPSSTVIEQGAEKLYGLIHARYVLTKPGLQVIMERYRNQEFGTCPRTFCQENPVVPTGRYDAPGIDTVKLFCSRCGDLYHPRETKYRSIDGAFFSTTLPGLLFLSFPELIPENSIIFPTSRHDDSSEGSAATIHNPLTTNNPEEIDRLGASTPESVDMVQDPSLPASPSLSNKQQRASASGSRVVNINNNGDDSSESEDGQASLQPGPSAYQQRIFGFKVSERSKVGPRMGWLRAVPRDDELRG